jgi:hypothetical protein
MPAGSAWSEQKPEPRPKSDRHSACSNLRDVLARLPAIANRDDLVAPAGGSSEIGTRIEHVG